MKSELNQAELAAVGSASSLLKQAEDVLWKAFYPEGDRGNCEMDRALMLIQGAQEDVSSYLVVDQLTVVG